MAATESVLQSLIDRNRPLDGVSMRSWAAIRAAFPGRWFDEWVERLSTMVESGLGTQAILSFVHVSPLIARQFGPQAALALVANAVRIGDRTNRSAAAAFLDAAGTATARSDDPRALDLFAEIVDELAVAAPESVSIVLERVDRFLSTLRLGAFRRWVLTGIRLHANDPDRRFAYFSLADEEALRIFDQEASALVFGDIERRLKALLTALWGVSPIIRPAVLRSAVNPVRRTSFSDFLVRMPETFRGFSNADAEKLFKASIAHVGAHMAFSERFEVRSLKPLQVALISAIEDARVEQLAMRELPGLRRLWQPFHTAEATGGQLALPLLARLSRSLIDPDFNDDNPWVRKGREMFLDARSRWEDQTTSRTIGGLLGNDLGQMRVQFNPRTYVVQPAYRDDNLGIWDFGEQREQTGEESDVLFESVRVRQTENDSEPHQRKKAEEDQSQTRSVRIVTVDNEVGIPVARYPEWDYRLGRERIDWTTILEYQPRAAPASIIDRIYHEYSDVLDRIVRLVGSTKVSRPVRQRAQPEGERMDLDACIRAAIDLRAGLQVDQRVYETQTPVGRDLSVLVLLDISESTKDLVPKTSTSVFALERAAAVLLAEAMARSGDPFAIRAFCSNGRSDVRYFRIKDFARTFGERERAHLAGLRGGYSTRIGAAMRHAGEELKEQLTHRRLLLVVTDGEPSDVDVPERRYLVEDARKAVHKLAHDGIDVFCVGLDSAADAHLKRIFGQRNVVTINRVAALPERLPMLYFRLTH